MKGSKQGGRVLYLSLVDGGELDEVLPAVCAAVGAARQLVEAPHDPVNLDPPVLTGVHSRLELKGEGGTVLRLRMDCVCKTCLVLCTVDFSYNILEISSKLLQGDPSARGLGYVGISSVSYRGYRETELMSA